MFSWTPHDNERRQYSRTALARLVLASRARGLSGAAAELVVTRYDQYCGTGGRVSEAAQLAEYADEVLAAAVIYERERGSSWKDIGRYLGVSGPDAEQRFTPVIESWQTGFEVPYRLDETGRKRVPQLPTAAYDPDRLSRDLDLWAAVQLGFGDRHAVSGGLDGRADDAPAESADDDIRGRIKPQFLTTFLDLLADYVRHGPANGDWNGLTQALENGRHEDPAVWHSHVMAGILDSVEVSVAWEEDSELMSVVAVRVHSAELRLRISTLLDAFELA